MNAWKNNSKIKILTVLSVIFLCSSFLAFNARSEQDNLYRLQPNQLMPLKRPGVVFEHDEHNYKAELEDCSVCHHVYDQKGKLIPGESSAGISCAECHFESENAAPGLRRAYHMQCKNCHIRKNKGPVTCAGCHPD